MCGQHVSTERPKRVVVGIVFLRFRKCDAKAAIGNDWLSRRADQRIAIEIVEIRFGWNRFVPLEPHRVCSLALCGLPELV